MKQLRLSQDQVAKVDDEDFDHVSQFSWAYRPEPNNKQGYAVRNVRASKGQYRKEYLHRAIMNPPPGYTVTFLNHDRLDCRKENLKVVTTKQARRQHRVRSDSKSGIKGVKFNDDTELWDAYYIRDGTRYHVGSFTTAKKAGQEYEKAVKQYDEADGLSQAA